jgi:hypothetical protein
MIREDAKPRLRVLHGGERRQHGAMGAEHRPAGPQPVHGVPLHRDGRRADAPVPAGPAGHTVDPGVPRAAPRGLPRHAGREHTARRRGGAHWRPRRGQRMGWIADFLGLPPLGNGATFADEFDQLAAWDDDRIRAEIGQHALGPLPAALGRPGLRDAVADMLRWTWTTTLVSDWPRRRRVLEADILTRTSRLASHGCAGPSSRAGSPRGPRRLPQGAERSRLQAKWSCAGRDTGATGGP